MTAETITLRTDMKSKLRIFILMLVFLAATHAPLQAGEFKARGGATLTLLGIPMIGFSGVAAYQSEFDLLGFTDYQEITFYGHMIGGQGKTSQFGETGRATITWKSIEMDYFLLKDYGTWKIGPGIGYGIGEMTEDTGTMPQSISPYFTGNDIHYGVLLLKGVRKFGEMDCEATLSSFGGLIGGGFLCGYEF